MAAFELLKARRSAPWIALAVGAALAIGCASSGAESEAAASRDSLPPQAMTPPPAPQPTENPTPPPTPPTSTAALARAPAPVERPVDLTSPPPPRAGDTSLTFIEPADEEPVGEAPTLAEAAARERARRQGGAPPAVVINNQNLASYAAGGVLTIAEPAPSQEAMPGADESDGAPVGPTIEESYWRQRGLAIRKRWRDAVDEIPELVGRVEELRQRFYSADDPAYRDGEIKPLWDKALADLEEARYLAGRGEQEVLAYLEEGRRAGALPGWLREGAELEPEPVVLKAEPDPAEAREPEIYDETPPPGP